MVHNGRPDHSIEHPRNVCVREDWIIDPLDTWLATAFDSPHLALFDAGADPDVVAEWITATQAERAHAQAQLVPFKIP